MIMFHYIQQKIKKKRDANYSLENVLPNRNQCQCFSFAANLKVHSISSEETKIRIFCAVQLNHQLICPSIHETTGISELCQRIFEHRMLYYTYLENSLSSLKKYDNHVAIIHISYKVILLSVSYAYLM